MAAADVTALGALEGQAVRHPWSHESLRQCLAPGHGAWVLEGEQELLGYGVTALVADQAEVLNLVVASHAQGQGLGGRLLQALIDQAQDQGMVEMFLEVRASNGPALGLYAKAGFTQVGVRKDYYRTEQGREDALLMRLAL